MAPNGECEKNWGNAERVVAVASFAIAATCLALAFLRPLPVAPMLLGCLALSSIALNSARLVWMRAPGTAALLTFLPAPPIAAALFASSPGLDTARALAAAAFAFEARTWFVALACRAAQEREALARDLERCMPSSATVFVDNDIESEVPAAALREGHLFRLASGQRAPADGFVTFGSSFVDERLSESGVPDLRMKGMGSLVYAGTRNQGGALLVRATGVGTWTLLSRLAARARLGLEQNARSWIAADAALTLLVAVVLFAVSGPAAALRAFLVATGAGCLALFARFESDLAFASSARRWLWGTDGVKRLNGCGILVTSAGGVLTEGRPRLAAVECGGHLSEDAVLGLMGPLARKLETPAAFALLLELRARNIPLQQCEFFQPLDNGGLAIVGGEELRWISYAGEPLPAPLETFAREHEYAGDEIHLLERHGAIEAAAAFRDEPVKGASESAAELRSHGFPALLVSPAPKRTVARLQTELGLEHAQGESGPRETDALFRRLSDEGLSPIWVQRDSFRPAAAHGLISLPGAPGAADLQLASTTLPEIAAALSLAHRAGRAFKVSTGLIFSCQTGLLAALLAADGAIAGRLHWGVGWHLSDPALALAAVVPVFLSLAILRGAFPRQAESGEAVAQSSQFL
jgi:Cd2+/Zn2+-exporting ATPase